ncbi:MAG: hypothetical protein KBS98_00505 [Flavobacterium sp.]|nr:hypothetical protein [Candidatus Neoflavobacterium equi]
MKLENIFELFYQGAFEKCLTHLDLFLLINGDDIDALLLKACCMTQILYSHDLYDTKDFKRTDFAEIEPIYHYILSLDPLQPDALVGLLDIWNYEFEESDFDETMSYINALKKSELYLNMTSRFETDLNLKHKKFDEVLRLLEERIAYNNETFANNRSMREVFNSQATLIQYDVLFHDLNNWDAAHAILKKEIQFLVFDSGLPFVAMAKTALNLKEYELLDTLLQKLIPHFNEDEETDEEVLKLYDELLNRIPAAEQSPILVDFILLVQKNNAELLDFDLTDLLAEAMKYIKLFPERFEPYHYAGSVLFDHDNFEAAHAYLKKAVEIKGFAETVYRYIICHYNLYKTYPDIEEWPQDEPLQYFNMGALFSEYEMNLEENELISESIALNTQFFQQAFEGFTAYFEDNAYLSSYYYNEQLWAMCANNYAVCLLDKESYHEALNVCKIGLEISTYWELHITAATIYNKLNNFEKEIFHLDEALSMNIKDAFKAKYIVLELLKTLAQINLNNFVEAKQSYAVIKRFFDRYISSDEAIDLDEESLELVQEAKEYMAEIEMKIATQESLN